MRPDQSALARIYAAIGEGCAKGDGSDQSEPRVIFEAPAEMDAVRAALRAYRPFVRGEHTKAARRASVRRKAQLVGWHEIHAARSALERGTK